MRVAEIDWSYIRTPLIFFLSAMVIGAVLLVASIGFASDKERLYQRERSRLLANRNRYHTLDEEERVIEAYLPRFEALRARGLIGREQRLNWIESLREASKQVGLPELRYAIDVQEPLDEGTARAGAAAGVRIYSSKMRIDLGLLHEGDLFELLSRLQAASTGIYVLDRCHLRRPLSALDMSGARANIAASCQLDWLTVRAPPRLEDRSR